MLLTVGRVLQGLAVGGAWSGSVLLAGEWTDPRRRGFTTSFAQVGAPAGYVLANGALALMTAIVSDDAFFRWGWRVPFLLSIVLVGVGPSRDQVTWTEASAGMAGAGHSQSASG